MSFIHDYVSFNGFSADKKKFRKALRSLMDATEASDIRYNLKTGGVTTQPFDMNTLVNQRLTSSVLSITTQTDGEGIVPVLLHDFNNDFYMVAKGTQLNSACWTEIIKALAATHVLAPPDMLAALGLELFEAVLYPKEKK